MNINIITTILACLFVASFSPSHIAPPAQKHIEVTHIHLLYELIRDPNVIQWVCQMPTQTQLARLLPMLGQDVRDQDILRRALLSVEDKSKVRAFADILSDPGLSYTINLFRLFLKRPARHDSPLDLELHAKVIPTIENLFTALEPLLTEAHARNLPISNLKLIYPDHETMVPVTPDMFQKLEELGLLANQVEPCWKITSYGTLISNPRIIDFLGLDTRFEYHLEPDQWWFGFLDPANILVIKAIPRPLSLDPIV